MATILIVEDEAVIAEAVAAYLEKDGHKAVIESNGLKARDRLQRQEFQLIILDLMLPGMSGEELCRFVRSRSSVPVLMLTAKSDEASLIYGFRIGADDYLSKPFSPRELAVRVAALLRRTEGRTTAAVIEFGEGAFELDLQAKKLFRSGRDVHLTPMEFDLLAKLVSRPGRVFSREDIICSVMGDDFEGMERTVDSHIRNLRSKIEEDSRNPRYILTQRGKGFYFNA